MNYLYHWQVRDDMVILDIEKAVQVIGEKHFQLAYDILSDGEVKTDDKGLEGAEEGSQEEENEERQYMLKADSPFLKYSPDFGFPPRILNWLCELNEGPTLCIPLVEFFREEPVYATTYEAAVNTWREVSCSPDQNESCFTNY